jgi:quercetin dioxygenase-like cupin family protein
MSVDDLDLSAQFALGWLGGLRRAEAEKRMQVDAAFRASVRLWENRLAALDTGELAPPPAAFDRVMQAVDIAEAVPDTATQFADSAVWIRDFLPGIDQRLLYMDPASGRQSFVLRMSPGSVLPEHGHAHDEECYVIEGRVQVGGRTMGIGDFHVAKAGGRHLPIIAETQALLLISSVY